MKVDVLIVLKLYLNLLYLQQDCDIILLISNIIYFF